MSAYCHYSASLSFLYCVQGECNAHPLGEADVLQNVLDEELGATVWISAATRLQRLHQWQYFGWPVHSRRARKDKVPHPVLSHHLRDATDNCQDV